MIRVEKQSSDCCPPEHPVCPPYIPGSFPPLTKSNPAGKKTLYSKVTLFASVKSTTIRSSQYEIDDDEEGDILGVMYMPVPPTGAFLLAGLIEPFGNKTCITVLFVRSN